MKPTYCTGATKAVIAHTHSVTHTLRVIHTPRPWYGATNVPTHARCNKHCSGLALQELAVAASSDLALQELAVAASSGLELQELAVAARSTGGS